MLESEYRKRSGRIEVHTPEILEEIVADNALHDSILYNKNELSQRYPRSASAPIPKSRSRTSSSSHFPVRLGAGSTTPLHGCRIHTWLNEDSIKDIQERSNFESRSVRNLYRTVLDNEESLVHDVDAFLEYVDIANENRRVELFKKWSERVYTPLQEKVQTEMKSGNFKSYEKKKRQLYDRYIDYRNRKGTVFLDVFSPEEYDPLELNNSCRPGPLKAKTENLDRKDPLLHQDFKKIVEDQDMIRCQTGRTTRAKDIKNYHLPPEPLVPLGRQNTTCRTWLRMPIHDIDSTPRLKSRERMSNTCNNSQIDFQTWQSAVPSPEVVDIELHCQKKRLFPEKYSRRPILEWPTVPITCQMRNDSNSNIFAVASE